LPSFEVVCEERVNGLLKRFHSQNHHPPEHFAPIRSLGQQKGSLYVLIKN
jgi:hypothetical protein